MTLLRSASIRTYSTPSKAAPASGQKPLPALCYERNITWTRKNQAPPVSPAKQHHSLHRRKQTVPVRSTDAVVIFTGQDTAQESLAAPSSTAFIPRRNHRQHEVQRSQVVRPRRRRKGLIRHTNEGWDYTERIYRSTNIDGQCIGRESGRRERGGQTWEHSWFSGEKQALQ